MNINLKLFFISFIIFLLNIPFGMWRKRSKKFSLNWFLSIYLPVPFIFLMRIKSGIGLNPLNFPIFIFAFFMGQFIGSRILK